MSKTYWICGDLSHGRELCPGYCGDCDVELHPIMSDDFDRITALQDENAELKVLRDVPKEVIRAAVLEAYITLSEKLVESRLTSSYIIAVPQEVVELVEKWRKMDDDCDYGTTMLELPFPGIYAESLAAAIAKANGEGS